MTVKISDEHLALAQEQAARDGYADVGAYLEALIEEAVFDFPVESREEFVASLREGLEDIAAGRSRPADEVMAEIAKKYNLPPVDEAGL
jgi:predicted transcriptional regulator